MLLGPYDKRLKRSRCSNCATRHLKCSKTFPCLKCSQDFLLCQYPSSGRNLISGSDWHQGTVRFTPPLQCQSPIAAGPVEEVHFFHQFFDVFLPQNQFSGGAADWHSYLFSSLPQCRGHFSALAGLGALVTYKHGHRVPCTSRVLVSALKLYQDGVRHLQGQINKSHPHWDSVSILSVAFLLSMFELIYDATGLRWNSHMGFGTSVVLKACGPSHFRSSCALSMYREIRLFEISRAALFSQATILADSEWLMHDQACRATSGDWNMLEVAFDLFLRCVKLGRRVGDHHGNLGPEIDCQDDPRSANQINALIPNLNMLRRDGIHLQSQLTFYTSSSSSETTFGENTTARIYFHAISIYLSGIFDGGTTTSERRGAPILQPEHVEHHCESIVDLSWQTLEQGGTSSLLLLVPLRIAGNRCNTSAQRQKVLSSIQKIESLFAVAQAFREELIEIWNTRGLDV